MARVRIIGAETGDFGEITSAASGTSVDNVVKRTGGYSYKASSTATGLSTICSGLALSHSYYRFYWRTDRVLLPGTNWQATFMRLNDSGAATQMQLVLQQDSAGVWTVYLADSTFTPVDSEVITVLPHTWYRFEVDFTKGAGTGACIVKLDGTTICSVTSQQFGANNTDSWLSLAVYTDDGDLSDLNGRNYWLDDIAVDDAALPGPGQIIARQGAVGTPTYDQFTKTAGNGTAAGCWSDTPYGTTANCSEGTNTEAQTMLVATFADYDPGKFQQQGDNVITSSDTIIAAKVAAVAKIGSAGNFDIRRRVSASDTDVTKALTTSDAYTDSAPFTGLTYANLSDNTTEIGAQNVTGTTVTVEDMWLMVEYLPASNAYTPPFWTPIYV